MQGCDRARGRARGTRPGDSREDPARVTAAPGDRLDVTPGDVQSLSPAGGRWSPCPHAGPQCHCTAQVPPAAPAALGTCVVCPAALSAPAFCFRTLFGQRLEVTRHLIWLLTTLRTRSSSSCPAPLGKQQI